MATPKITVQQGLANSSEAAAIQRFLSTYPGLEYIQQTHQLARGYSGSVVLLAVAGLRNAPPAHWVLKLGDREDTIREEEGYLRAKAVSAVAGTDVVTLVKSYTSESSALFVYDFAGLQGRPPIDLETGIRTIAALEMTDATVGVLDKWTSLRYQLLPSITDHTTLAQVMDFLTASRQSLTLDAPPEVLDNNKLLQEPWRCIQRLRRSVKLRLSGHGDDAEKGYWACLVAYAVSFATYSGVRPYARRLAFVDAADLFTKHIQTPDLKARQVSFSIHDAPSAEIESRPALARTASSENLLRRSISDGNAILVVGPYLGRSVGIEPVPLFLQRVHADLEVQPPGVTGIRVLLESLKRNKRQRQIAKSMKDRVSTWHAAEELGQIGTTVRWASIINYHFHAQVYRHMVASGIQFVRIDDVDSLQENYDQVVNGATAYFPFFGDAESSPERLVASAAALTARYDVLGDVAKAIERRLKPLSLVLWRCEDVDVESLMTLRDAFSQTLAFPVDTYFLSDQADETRDSAFDAIGIWIVRRQLGTLTSGVSGDKGEKPTLERHWTRGDVIYTLPDVSRHTKGLIEFYDEFGSVGPYGGASADMEFLLGGPPTREDIAAGKVVNRDLINQTLMPAIQDGIHRAKDDFRVVFVEGRAGAGTTTALCTAAEEITVARLAPCFVVARTGGYPGQQWQTAGELLAEVSNQVRSPALLFYDAVEPTHGGIERLARGVLERQGEVLVVIGGRTEIVKELQRRLGADADGIVQIEDTLAADEWLVLAEILQRNGFSTHLSLDDLCRRLQENRLLLPAIYEATDRQNRKFREIVAYEYHRYDNDQKLQRAYRLVCALGVFGFQVTYYWLLKAVGGLSVNDAAGLLTGLSDDIIVEQPGENQTKGDLLIGPRHRLVAEAVLEVGAPELSFRLADLRALIGTANMMSQHDGGIVVALLAHKGPLFSWLRQEAGSSAQVQNEALALFRTALGNGPIAPSAEITLNQHLALLLRSTGETELALKHAQRAYDMEPDNVARRVFSKYKSTGNAGRVELYG
ncbi:MAG: hypothetical protein JXA30_13750 [Deltaproteobacteria bacterium]|nr:hypothetical protein [Deltaproteobacteria bacterium]